METRRRACAWAAEGTVGIVLVVSRKRKVSEKKREKKGRAERKKRHGGVSVDRQTISLPSLFWLALFHSSPPNLPWRGCRRHSPWQQRRRETKKRPRGAATTTRTKTMMTPKLTPTTKRRSEMPPRKQQLQLLLQSLQPARRSRCGRSALVGRDGGRPPTRSRAWSSFGGDAKAGRRRGKGKRSDACQARLDLNTLAFFLTSPLSLLEFSLSSEGDRSKSARTSATTPPPPAPCAHLNALKMGVGPRPKPLVQPVTKTMLNGGALLPGQRIDFNSLPIPAGYVPGVGRGAAGFVTRSDIGSVRTAPGAPPQQVRGEKRRKEEKKGDHSFSTVSSFRGLSLAPTPLLLSCSSSLAPPPPLNTPAKPIETQNAQ